MRYLLDTGVLLRLVNHQSAAHDQVRSAVRTLKAQGHITVSTFQNRCEFWNVCTRPAAARGGFGLTLDETTRRLRTLERITYLLPDTPETYAQWKDLVVRHSVQGVQVHDTRIVALMLVHGVDHILTLNPTDFRRFATLTVVTPEMVLASPPPAMP